MVSSARRGIRIVRHQRSNMLSREPEEVPGPAQGRGFRRGLEDPLQHRFGNDAEDPRDSVQAFGLLRPAGDGGPRDGEIPRIRFLRGPETGGRDDPESADREEIRPGVPEASPVDAEDDHGFQERYLQGDRSHIVSNRFVHRSSSSANCL